MLRQCSESSMSFRTPSPTSSRTSFRRRLPVAALTVLPAGALAVWAAKLMAKHTADGSAGDSAKGKLKVRDIDPELRFPALPWLTVSLNNTSRKALQGLLLRSKDRLVGEDPAVTLTERWIPASGTQPAVRVLQYEPRGSIRRAGAVLWIHGGGLVIGAPEQNHALCSAIARELGVVVVAVAYRLAPEHPYPAGLDDCFRTLTWVHEQAESLGVERDRIVVAGESAGGGLAAAVAQRAVDTETGLRAQILIYPMLDDRTVLENIDARRGQFVWTRGSNRYGWSAYLGRPPRRSEAPGYAAPARRRDLQGMAPAWISVGDRDLFHDECLEYARRLQEAHVACSLRVVPGMYHAAEYMRPSVPSMREFSQHKIDAIREGLVS